MFQYFLDSFHHISFTIFVKFIPTFWTVKYVVSRSSQFSVLKNCLKSTEWSECDSICELLMKNWPSCGLSHRWYWRLYAGCRRFQWCQRNQGVLWRRKRGAQTFHSDDSSFYWQCPRARGFCVALAARNFLSDVLGHRPRCRWLDLCFDCGCTRYRPPRLGRKSSWLGIALLSSLHRRDALIWCVRCAYLNSCGQSFCP